MGSQERRRSKRIVLESAIEVKRIDTDQNEKIQIQIHDISVAGIGFFCDEILQLNAIYDSSITLWTKDVIKVLIRVVRAEMLEDECEYGATFIALSDTDAFRITVYEELEKSKEVIRNLQDENNS